ncbi:conserved hypothetical protein [Rubrivivax sp. A210]|uniref:DUF3108 domain-containing protein n=1 Tax=Rubrivivax sp. A210 TaxID=2772301 RepID=UPI00191AC388|nr:DUF3108 domain-containing protein [Rubrivivax sp. A210]CAD5372645.1 conserved hypothetical protein [Rubrivivax sp. A210]
MRLAPDKAATAGSRRRAGLLALGLAVTLAHLWLADSALPTPWGEGAAPRRRIEVAFVRELAPTQPPPAAANPPPPPRRLRAPPVPQSAASAQALAEVPVLAAALELPPPEALPPLAEIAPPPPEVPASAAAAAPVAAASAAAASSEVAVVWPPSTRLSYRLTGSFRGPIEGQARVEWLRDGTRYQVFMDVDVGPSFAPLMTRRVSSEGEITEQGLRPQRYEEITRIVLRPEQRRVILLDADRVYLANGREVPRPPGVQDSGSQFVQMTWLFTTQPQLLQVGRSIELPLALPGKVEPWIYDVLGGETLYTPAGPVATLHVKPRREAKAGSDLTAEFWVAPSLQYLPVRILIRQDAETHIDLLIERLPEQAARGR